MPEKPLLSAEDLTRIQDSLAQIGSQEEQSLPSELPITAISRNTETGQILLESDPEAETLSGRQLLDELAALSDFLGQSPEIVTQNTRLAARLGALALEQVSPEASNYSKTALLELRKTLKSLHQKIIGAVIVSTELRRDSKALRNLERFINPNPRLKRHYEELDRKEKGLLE